MSRLSLLFISFISILFQTRVYAILVDAAGVSWSAATGANITIFGLATYPSRTGCVFYFQNTTLLSNQVQYGEVLTLTPGSGSFFQNYTIPINCNAVNDDYTVLVHCFSKYYSFIDTAGKATYTTTGQCSA